MNNKTHNYNDLLESYNRKEYKKNEAVQQQIRESKFYTDNLITY